MHGFEYLHRLVQGTSQAAQERSVEMARIDVMGVVGDVDENGETPLWMTGLAVVGKPAATVITSPPVGIAFFASCGEKSNETVMR